jgi:hypothetical protein
MTQFQIGIIGSVALTNYIDIGRKPKDIDYIMSWDTYTQWLKEIKSCHKIHACYPSSNGKKQIVKYDNRIVEIEIAWKGSTAEEILNICVDEDKTGWVGGYYTAPLNLLYELKLSHRYLKNSPHFLKTMKDIRLMESKCAFIEHKEFFDRREKETYEYKHPALNVKKNEFFKDETYNFYQHDDLHEVVCLDKYPAYKDILEDGQEVKCSLNKWINLTNIQRLNCALEECYTLTLERGLIPNNFETDPKKTFEIALKKVCTSITSGWFREWCWNNYNFILENYNEEFVDKFKVALEAGRIGNFKN